MIFALRAHPGWRWNESSISSRKKPSDASSQRSEAYCWDKASRKLGGDRNGVVDEEAKWHISGQETGRV